MNWFNEIKCKATCANLNNISVISYNTIIHLKYYFSL